MRTLDLRWREEHPLPTSEGGNKNSRGQVLLVGGSEKVPGALRLTGESALRTGVGKLRVGTVRPAALPLGIAMPEIAVIALPMNDDGEIDRTAAAVLASSLKRCNTLILGPGMGTSDDVPALVADLVGALRPDQALLLDAAAVSCVDNLSDILSRHGGPAVITPHHGEMASLLDESIEAIAENPAAVASRAAREFGATIVLKAERTVIASPDGALLDHRSECPGLAIPGSGDVLAGIIGSLLARSVDPIVAAGWGVWLHEAAGRLAAGRVGPIGFLAREVVPEIPRLLPG